MCCFLMNRINCLKSGTNCLSQATLIPLLIVFAMYTRVCTVILNLKLNDEVPGGRSTSLTKPNRVLILAP